MIGSTLGSYRITKLLGEGGMGTVYQATDNIEREVAIKALRPQLTRDADLGGRFRSEAMALGRLHHPNIASLFHLLEEGEDIYLVMEFVEGQTLEELIHQRGALPPRLALDLLIDALHGFEHAHSRGVIHRDIKASNLMVSGEGVTKIMDFGIARVEGSGRLTQTGRPLGTLEYMSPEQVRGGEQDARSDIYSLGVLLFELLTGRVPFVEGSDFELMRAHLEKEPPSARFLVPLLPSTLDAILARCLAKDPSARFASTLELRGALETVAAELPLTATSPSSPSTSKTHAVRTTNPPAPGPRYATVPLEDRYATRVQGTPLPPPPSPVAPPAPPAVSPAVSPTPSAPTLAPSALPPRSAARSWALPASVACVGVLLVIGAGMARGFLRPAPRNSLPLQRAPLSQPSHAASRLDPPKKAVAAPRKPSPPTPTRQVRRRVRAMETSLPRRFKPRRVPREAAVRRESRIARAKPASRAPIRAISKAREAAALRAIIKGH